MTRMQPQAPQDQVRLPGGDAEWLEAQNYSHAPTRDRNGGVEFFNAIMGMPFRKGAVYRAYNSGEIPTALVSGRACASDYDLALWALRKKYRHQVRGRVSA